MPPCPPRPTCAAVSLSVHPRGSASPLSLDHMTALRLSRTRKHFPVDAGLVLLFPLSLSLSGAPAPRRLDQAPATWGGGTGEALVLPPLFALRIKPSLSQPASFSSLLPFPFSPPTPTRGESKPGRWEFCLQFQRQPLCARSKAVLGGGGKSVPPEG